MKIAKVQISYTPSVDPNVGSRKRQVKVNGVEVFTDTVAPEVASLVQVGLRGGDLLEITTTVYNKDDSDILATAYGSYIVPPLEVLPDTDFRFELVEVADEPAPEPLPPTE